MSENGELAGCRKCGNAYGVMVVCHSCLDTGGHLLSAMQARAEKAEAELEQVTEQRDSARYLVIAAFHEDCGLATWPDEWSDSEGGGGPDWLRDGLQALRKP